MGSIQRTICLSYHGKRKKNLTKYIYCFEFYLQFGKLSLRSGNENILMTHKEVFSLMSIEESSELFYTS